MKNYTQYVLILITSALVAAATACEPPPASNTAPADAVSSGAQPSPTPAALGSSETQLPVTLPVLDAMFVEESFAGELKSRLKLTDEQVERLRAVAREETASLGEEGEGSTAEATRRAAEKIREIIGEEKSREFAEFVRERWASGGEVGDSETLPSKPNSIPNDTRIVVNAPAYRMDVFKEGRLEKSYRIGIGYPEFPLPQGLRKASNIIFNPTWTPPDEPWVRGKVRPGEKVAAGSRLNPLGPVKIPIGLPSLIHGGKSAARLGSFASHGCVGLTDEQVQDFSIVLAHLGGASLTPEDVAAHAAKKTETKSVKLSNPVPVELRYETIVVEDGVLRIYRDVYDKGTNTEENLRAVLDAHGVSFDSLSEQERERVSAALKQMARDARGNRADGTPTPTPAPDAKSKRAPRVTNTVKGQKEISIELAVLRGKGYPAPVNLDSGGSAAKTKSTPAAKKQS